MLLEDRLRFLTIALVLFGLLVVGMLTDKVKDVLLSISLLGNLVLGCQLTSKD